MFVSENHLVVVRLRLAGLTNAQIAENTGLKKATIQDWISKLNRFYGLNIKAHVGCTLPCEICQERVYLKKVVRHIRCAKHMKPFHWINKDTPDLTGEIRKERRRVRVREWYRYRGGKEKRTRSALKWVRKKKAIDPVWREKFNKYHRDYEQKKKMLKLQGVG